MPTKCLREPFFQVKFYEAKDEYFCRSWLFNWFDPYSRVNSFKSQLAHYPAGCQHSTPLFKFHTYTCARTYNETLWRYRSYARTWFSATIAVYLCFYSELLVRLVLFRKTNAPSSLFIYVTFLPTSWVTWRILAKSRSVWPATSVIGTPSAPRANKTAKNRLQGNCFCLSGFGVLREGGIARRSGKRGEKGASVPGFKFAVCSVTMYKFAQKKTRKL